MPEPLTTPRLLLEPWTEAHTVLLAGLSAHPEVIRFVGAGQIWDRERANEVAQRQRAHWERHGFGWRAAVDRETGGAVGFIALNLAGTEAPELDPGDYEIGWWLCPEAWGRGLAREGGLAVRDDAFERIGVPSVVARIHADNKPSLAVASALGLTFESQTTGAAGQPVTIHRLNADAWKALPA